MTEYKTAHDFGAAANMEGYPDFESELKELNKALRNIVFSNEKYEFLYMPSESIFSGIWSFGLRQDKNYGAEPSYQQYVRTPPIIIPFRPIYSVKKHKWLIA